MLKTVGKQSVMCGSGKLEVAWEVEEDVHATELDNDGVGTEKRDAVCGNSERVATMALWVLSAEKLYLAKREKYFLKNVPKRTGAGLAVL